MHREVIDYWISYYLLEVERTKKQTANDSRGRDMERRKNTRERTGRNTNKEIWTVRSFQSMVRIAIHHLMDWPIRNKKGIEMTETKLSVDILNNVQRVTCLIVEQGKGLKRRRKKRKSNIFFFVNE